MAEKPKTGWDKADILLKPLGGLFTAVAVVWLGHLGTEALKSREMTEANIRLYAELMSSRERSDSALRQGMFQTIIDKFLSVSPTQEKMPTLATYEQDVLRLEILAYNFHDALDLAPLFKDVYRKLTGDSRYGEPPATPIHPTLEQPDEVEAYRLALLDRLERVAREVTDKQIAALEDSGGVVRKTLSFDEYDKVGLVSDFINERLYLHKPGNDGKTYPGKDAAVIGKGFAVDIIDVDRDKKEIEVRLAVWPLAGGTDPIVDITFSVGFFDFPMIDNTRIQSNERCAVVLTGFGEYSANVALVYFPGTRASLKEKPFYDEIVNQLKERAAQF